MLQAGRFTGSTPNEVTAFLNIPNPSSCTMAPGSTQHLREISTMNLPRSKGKPACKADNPTAICEQTVEKMLEP
jgi:hypothetical protein